LSPHLPARLQKGFPVTLRWLALVGLLTTIHPAWSQSPPPKVPDGFKVELILQAPAIEAPTALCVAPNGDVYYAEDPMDMAGPPTKNLDRIWLLKGGDPNKKILFADKMWAVMGLEIVRDKLYVVHAPYVTVFTLDGEGKPAKREDLFTDLGPPVAGLPSFNDHIPSGIRMGMDGWLYVSIGDKGIPKMTRKEKDQGSVHVAEGRWRYSKEGHHISLEGGGVIRFRPDGSRLEIFACGTRNHLDVPMDEHDRIFVRDNTDDGLGWWTRLMYLPRGAFMGYPWAYTKHPDECLPMIRDFGGGSPCGGWVYCDDGLPETYRGRIFHCEWGQGKVYAVKVAPDGAGFKFVDQITFMDPEKTGVKDFRPFTLRPTADGRGFYVTDWGYSGWLNPAKAGRLWKVTYVKDDVKPKPRGKDSDSIDELINSLDHPAHSERLRAQRALIAKGEAAGIALEHRERLSARATRHVLWVLRATCPPNWYLFCQSIGAKHKDAGVRLEFARVSCDTDVTSLALKKGPHSAGILVYGPDLDGLMGADPDPQVRSQMRQSAYLDGRPLAEYFGKEKDPWVRYASLQQAKQHLSDWLAILRSSSILMPGRSDKKAAVDDALWVLTDEFNLEAVGFLKGLMADTDPSVRQQAVQVLARVHHDRKPYASTWWGTQPAGQKPPARDVAWAGTALVRQALLEALADPAMKVRKAAVAGLIDMKDPATLGPIIERFGKEADLQTRADLVRAIAAVETRQSRDFLLSILRHDQPVPVQLEALAGMEKWIDKQQKELQAQLASSIKIIIEVEPEPLQVRALEVVAHMKGALAQAIAALGVSNSRPKVRQAAAATLGKLGEPAAALLLVPLLSDRESIVRTAAVRSLGQLKAREAVPALIKATADDTTQFDAIKALSQMPDPRALTAYLTGLGSKNADLRNTCKQALAAIRDQAAPTLEQLVKRHEICADLLPELRAIYSSFDPILTWRLVGPFPNDGKAYPPESDYNPTSVYKTAGKELKWQPVQADAKNHGMIDLAARYTPNTDVVAYGYAEVESSAARDAQVLIGSDDSIIVWLNGKKVHEHPDDRAWAHDQDKVNVKLAAGKNQFLIKCGNHGGPWAYSVAVSAAVDRYAFLKGGPQKFDLEAFRKYARAHKGDADHGRRLFMDLKGLACVKCHALGGQGGQVGPDLAGISLKYKREDLMTSILEPSRTIAQGYETIVVTTTSGQVLTGVFKGESADTVNLVDAEGKPHTVAKKDIEERRFSPVSTMPNGLNEGMSLQDFAEVIAFLEAQRDEKKGTADKRR
jgi:putative membrane-bound dehydrogenase-like protein